MCNGAMMSGFTISFRASRASMSPILAAAHASGGVRASRMAANSCGHPQMFSNVQMIEHRDRILGSGRKQLCFCEAKKKKKGGSPLCSWCSEIWRWPGWIGCRSDKDWCRQSPSSSLRGGSEPSAAQCHTQKQAYWQDPLSHTLRNGT